jgi:endonuclease/exonuclease/phosphatase family metal-dependent hydrolase
MKLDGIGIDMKLVSWNTQWCCGLDGAVSPQRIVDGARAIADFDVLCLQEIAQGFHRLQGAPGDQPAQLAALLPGYRCFFGAAVDEFAPDGSRQRFGNLIATRLPVARVQHHPLPSPADAGVCSMPRMCSVVTVIAPQLGPVRVMTTHLEYYSASQRLAQARALRAQHDEACATAAAPPQPGDDGSPFQTRCHTPHAVLCGDFNAAASDAAVAAICAPAAAPGHAQGFKDAWPLAHGATPQAPTFRLFDRTYGADPMACDFVFVSEGLASQVRSVQVDLHTRASDHQPVFVEFGD